MAVAQSQKEIKQPDAFIRFTHRIWDLLTLHVKHVVIVAVTAIVLTGAAFAWQAYSESRNRRATTQLTRAMKIYLQPVVPVVSPTATPASAESSSEVPQFSDEKKKLEAAEKAFTEVINTYRGLAIADMALLMRGGVYRDQGKADLAIKDYEAFLNSSEDPLLKQTANEGLLYAYESKKAYDQALALLKTWPQDGTKKATVVYHEGRLLALKGNTAAAKQRFAQVGQLVPSTPLANQAADRLMLLDQTAAK